ncbi:DNA cytosine methyltransferase [Geodermatophilus sp. CPCC 206100]|uniref:DNA cytosine methyltransferase n=1 Tax=Geodermatophilus sp. CPCC 206100 TaxID=3020054 RepID=UPI003AFFA1C0
MTSDLLTLPAGAAHLHIAQHAVSGPKLADFGLATSGSTVDALSASTGRGVLQSLELFAGGGGMALGMRAAGFSHQALVEWWAPAARVLRHNAELRPELWKPDQIVEDDVRQVLGDLGDRGPVQLIAGGPPCQPFSFAGAHAGDTDERNMFPAALDTVRRLRPQLVVFENVPGLTRPSFAPYLDYVKAQLRHPDIAPRSPDELWSDHHARILASDGEPEYRVYQDLIDAADLGVPQSRRRVFLIAIRHDVHGADTWTDAPRTHSRDVLLHQQYVTGEYWERHGLEQPEVPLRQRGHVLRVERIGVPETLKPWSTLRDALADVPEPDDADELPGWPNHRAIPGARTYAKHTGSPLDMPSKTIKAGVHGVSGGEAMLRELDGTVRYLSVRESALVQGFPTDYEFPGPRSRVMGVIGNAVAVDVAATVGMALRDHTGL